MGKLNRITWAFDCHASSIATPAPRSREPNFKLTHYRKFAYVRNEGLQPILKRAWYPVPSTNGMGSAVMLKCFRSTFRISCIRFSTFGQVAPVFAPSRMMPSCSAIARKVTHA